MHQQKIIFDFTDLWKINAFAFYKQNNIFQIIMKNNIVRLKSQSKY
jgi:hypothetical protein